jgi:hypothetical protein
MDGSGFKGSRWGCSRISGSKLVLLFRVRIDVVELRSHLDDLIGWRKMQLV